MKSRRLTKYFSIDSQEVVRWINRLSSLEDLYYSCPLFIKPFNVKSLLNFKQRVSKVYAGEEKSEFYLALEKRLFPNDAKCKYCGKPFHTNQFRYLPWPSKGKWPPHCGAEQCLREKYKSHAKDPNVGEKISKAKKAFYKTEKGKSTAAQIGSTNSRVLKQFHATPEGKKVALATGAKISISHTQDIAAGKWTPGINNRWTRWQSKILIDGVEHKFRSSWEACFWFCNKHLAYETFRCKYTDVNGKVRSYIGDFYDEETRTLYELKPAFFFKKEYVKMSQVISFCLENEIRFVLINEHNLLDYIDAEQIGTNESAQIQFKKVTKNVL